MIVTKVVDPTSETDMAESITLNVILISNLIYKNYRTKSKTCQLMLRWRRLNLKKHSCHVEFIEFI